MSADDSDLSAVESGAAESPRARFRRHLRSGEMDLDQIRRHIESAATQVELDSEARLALDELVSHIGWLLGFESDRDEAEDIDVWVSGRAARLVVHVVRGETLIGQLSNLARARDRLLASTSMPARDVSILCVVSGVAPNWRHLEEVIVVRRLGGHIRAVSIDSLLTLAAARANGLRHVDVVALLRPQRALADGMIDILARYGNRADVGNHAT
jgi:hypothetical protein